MGLVYINRINNSLQLSVITMHDFNFINIPSWALAACTSKHTTREVISNRWTGLWTGLLDWTDGLDYQT